MRHPQLSPFIIAFFALFIPGARAATVAQIAIDRVELMPNQPEPYAMKDWKALAEAYDRYVFDFTLQGQYLPLIWWDDTRINYDRRAFGLPRYVGEPGARGADHEAIICMGAVLSASVAGIDKAAGEHDWPLMCEQYFNKANGEDLILNRASIHSGQSFWRDLFPAILFYALADRYPQLGQTDRIIEKVIEKLYPVSSKLKNDQGMPDLNYTAFDFETQMPVYNGKWTEPDALAGIAWISFMAWRYNKTFNNQRLADVCIQNLQRYKIHPTYEALQYWAPITAVRMNAELGRRYDVKTLIDWCFEPSDARPGWGVIAERWGDYDCHGLVGLTEGDGARADAMNTFIMAAALAPIPRYDERFARAIGKWILNLANSARLFYPGALPAGHESDADWQGDPDRLIAYESLHKTWDGQTPYAAAVDPGPSGPVTGRCLAGASYAGMLGGIVAKTNVEKILRIDCLATDFFHEPAHPTYLYYNPYERDKTVEIDVGPEPRILYNPADDDFVSMNARGLTQFKIPADTVVMIVLAPAGGKIAQAGRKLLIDGIAVDYTPSRSTPPPGR